ncbi:uncharacterized protein LOC143284517 [Babylonia areolata]|uniref:uncharacterized protein LOC143284517 n=1 Tax=Babylonia areolata TaxID=304850 RepID=UPI003FD6A4BE
MAASTQTLLALLTFITGALGWQCAKYKHYFSQQPDYIDCFWDCCGNSFDRHCCAPIAIIVGCAICGAVVLVAVIVFLCCFWQRRRKHYGNQPRLFHNRRPVSAYPAAQPTVTNPAPYVSYGQKPPPDQFFN